MRIWESLTNYYVNVLRNPARYYTGRIQVFCANRSNSTVPVLSATSVSSLIPCYRQAAFPRNHVPRLWPARVTLRLSRHMLYETVRLVRWVPSTGTRLSKYSSTVHALTGWAAAVERPVAEPLRFPTAVGLLSPLRVLETLRPRLKRGQQP